MIMMDSKRKLLVVILTSMFFCELTVAMGFGEFARMFPFQGKSNGTTCGDVAKVREHMENMRKNQHFHSTASRLENKGEAMAPAFSTSTESNKFAASELTSQNMPTQTDTLGDRSTTNSGEVMTFASSSPTEDDNTVSESSRTNMATQESTLSVSIHSSAIAPTCPGGLISKNCSCQGTCQDPNGCENNCTGGMTCGCDNDLLMQGDGCVPKEQCGCYVDASNKVIPEGGHIFIGCETVLYCTNNTIHEDTVACDGNSSSCTANRNRCKCNHDYYGNGRKCTKHCWELYHIGYIKHCENTSTSGNNDNRCFRHSNATQDCTVAVDCKDIFDAGHNENGFYYIKPTQWKWAPFKVYCDMTDGGGWTVFQRRTRNEFHKFRRNWQSYKNGFYNSDDSFWLGNSQLFYLTGQKKYELLIRIKEVGNDVMKQETYSFFRIPGNNERFKLEKADCVDTQADCALSSLKNGKFSTHDENNDGDNCGESRQGGWWYKSSDCGEADLNGNEFRWPNTTNIEYTEMKIRPKQ